MDTRRPHEIRQFTTDPNTRPFFRDHVRRRWLPLTDAEAEMLLGMDEDGRHTWFASLSRAEKRSRMRAADKATP